jgi:hypothetical protein
LGGRKVGQDSLGVQKNENEEDMLGVQEREGSGDSKSKTPTEGEGVTIETIERKSEGLRRDHKKGQDWISMRLVSVWELIIE